MVLGILYNIVKKFKGGLFMSLFDGFDSLDSVFDLDGNGELDLTEQLLEYDFIIDDSIDNDSDNDFDNIFDDDFDSDFDDD